MNEIVGIVSDGKYKGRRATIENFGSQRSTRVYIDGKMVQLIKRLTVIMDSGEPDVLISFNVVDL